MSLENDELDEAFGSDEPQKAEASGDEIDAAFADKEAAKKTAPVGMWTPDRAKAVATAVPDVALSIGRGMVNKPAQSLAGAAAWLVNPTAETYRKAQAEERVREGNPPEGATTPEGQALEKGIGEGMSYTGIPYVFRKTGEGIERVAGPEARDFAGSAASVLSLGLGRLPGLLKAGEKVPKVGGVSRETAPRISDDSVPPITVPKQPIKEGTPVDSEPVKGGLNLPDEGKLERAKILSRVGVETARDSSLSGDAGAAATDFQMSKFNQEPAGVAAENQFTHERQALTNHASGIVEDTGGSLGTDQEAILARGKTIAAPFDALRKWFKDQSKSDYESVKGKYGDRPIGNLQGTAELLKDPDFTETLLAKDQGGLLGSIQRQFERFQKLNPNGFSVSSAESFRKFLNSVWTPQTSGAIGKITEAIDNDVTAAAGEDFHAGARARIKLQHELLDDPEGISKAFDHDPRTPMNRSTPFTEIPDFIAGLEPDQLSHVVDTLKRMPAELKPQAEAALAEIRSQYANKLLDAGSSTQGQWNSAKVSQYLKRNAANLRIVFKDKPEILDKVRDLDSAGRILKVNQSYPGAAAQAAAAVKRGMASQILTKGASTVGGAVGAGAGAIFGPAGAVGGGAAGAAAGEALGSRLGTSASEKAALKRWQSGISRLSEIVPKEAE